jgi:hypothetical protein
LGRFEKNALAFADGQIKSTNHAKGELFIGEAKATAGGGRERWVLGLEAACIDAGVDDVEVCGIDPAGGAMLAFGNWGSGIVMALQEDLSDEGRDGDDRIGGGEEMFSAEGGAWAFGKVAGEDDEWAGINEAGGKKGGPVVVSVVGMEDAGASTAENASKGENLQRAEAGQGVVGHFLGGGGEGGLGGACHFDGPPEIGEALGEGEGLGIGAASAEVGVEVNGASSEIRRGHTKGRLA